MFTFKKFAQRFALLGAASLAAVAMSCSESDDEEPSNPDLVKGGFTLSAAGSSYGDLDTDKIYKQADLTAGIKTKIDVIAFNGQTGESGNENAIYPPYELDIFYDDACTLTHPALDEPIDGFCGGLVGFFRLPDQATALIQGAETLADVDALFALMGGVEGLDAYLDANDIDEITVATGKSFLVSTTEGELVAVAITTSGAQTVTLSSTKM